MKKKNLMVLLVVFITLLSLFSVVNAVELSKNVIKRAWLTNATGGPLPPQMNAWTAFRVNAEYELPNGVIKEGDTTTMTLPDGFAVAQPTSFDILDEDNKLVAKGKLVDGNPAKVVLTYTKYAETHSNTKGSFYFNTQINNQTQTQTGSIPVTLTVNGEVVPAGHVVYNPPQVTGVQLIKAGWRDGNNATIGHYKINVNQKNLEMVNAKLVDTLLSPGVEYVQGSLEVFEGTWVVNAQGTDVTLENQVNVTDQFRDKIVYQGNSFTIDIGNRPAGKGLQFRYRVKLSYEPVAGEKIKNESELVNNGTTYNYSTSYQIIIAGGTGQGYVFKIAVKKVDQQGQPVTGAVFDVKRVRTGMSVGTITTDSNGKGEITDLILDDYSLTEITTPQGYLHNNTVYNVSADDLNNPGKIVTIDVVNKKSTSIKAKKAWVDNGYVGPKKDLYFQLLADNVPVGDKKKVENTDWVEWTDLPKFNDNGAEINYSVAEVDKDGNPWADGQIWTATTSGSAANGFTLTNTYNPPKTKVKATKVWQGGPSAHPTVWFKLYRQSENVTLEAVPGAEIKELPNGTTEVIWANLAELDNHGKAYTFSVKEVKADGSDFTPDGYTKTEEGLKVTNKYTKTINIEGEKTWDDGNDQDGKRPKKITVILKANGDPIQNPDVQPDAQGKWKYSFKDLDEYDVQGNKITYSVTEEPIEGYEPTVTGYNINNKHIPEKTKVKVTKVWADNENQDGKRPSSVIIKLYADGVEVEGKTLTLNAENGWTGEFTELDKYKAGKKIVYTVKEVAIGNGYNSEVTGSAENGYVVTNSYTPGKVNVEGKKTWDDNDDQDGKRPTEIKINLMKQVGDGPVVKKDTKTVKAADDWKWSWMGLPEYEGGKKVTYSITEEAIAGYTTQVNGYNVTNKHVPETITIEGEKTWDDNENQDGKRPTEIKINLMKKVGAGPVVKADTKTVTAADGWKWKFENLAKFEGGVEIVYTIEEEAVEGYEAEVDGYNVTNTHETEKTRVEVTKVWEDNNDKAKKRPSSVTVRLFADGEYTGKTIELDKDGNWQGSFENLDKYKAGSKIKYTVKEEAVGNGYESEVTGSQEDGFTITNTRKPDDPPATVYDPIYVELLAEKKLANGKLKAGQFTFELYKGTKLADTVSNDASGKVTFKTRKFTSPATVKYTIKEVVGSDTKRINYDGTIYTVTVKVTDVGGKLVPSISYERDGMPYGGKLQFVNRVKPPKTGDSYTSLPLMLAAVSMLSLAGTTLLKKKRYRNK